GRKGERAAGNGAAMRVAPLAFCLDPHCPEDRTVLRDVCRITHHNDEAYAGAVAVVVAVRAAAFKDWLPDRNLPSLVAESLPDTSVRDRLCALAGLDRTASVLSAGRTFGCSGYVAESVPLAIFAAQRIAQVSFERVVEEAIEAGGDTDTIAAIAGQIAGAWVGLNGIDIELVRQVADIE